MPLACISMVAAVQAGGGAVSMLNAKDWCLAVRLQCCNAHENASDTIKFNARVMLYSSNP